MAKTYPSVDVQGRIDLKAGNQLMVATDAAVNGDRVALAYLSTAGHYRVLAGPYTRAAPGESNVAELRAIAVAVQDLGVDTPLVIHTDNATALWFLGAWRSGKMAYPVSYNTIMYREQNPDGVPSLVSLARLLAAGAPVTGILIKGHTGDPLNEAADSLAKAAVRLRETTGFAEYVEGVVRRRLGDLVNLPNERSAPPR